MAYRDNCRICGESYLDENLLACGRCGREFCYRCGDWRAAVCHWCQEKTPADAPPPVEEDPAPQ